MTDCFFRCHRCGEEIQGYFYFEVIKEGTPGSTNRDSLPQEAVCCTACHDAHPESKYAGGSDD